MKEYYYNVFNSLGYINEEKTKRLIYRVNKHYHGLYYFSNIYNLNNSVKIKGFFNMGERYGYWLDMDINKKTSDNVLMFYYL